MKHIVYHQWGHDFRPAYLKISNLKKHFLKFHFLALTNRALKLRDIINELGLEEPQLFEKIICKENIAYMVLKWRTNSF
jgi:ATP-dependent DNA helicase RecQ